MYYSEGDATFKSANQTVMIDSIILKFSVFCYIIEPRKKNMRLCDVTLQYVPTYRIYLKSEKKLCLCMPEKHRYYHSYFPMLKKG